MLYDQYEFDKERPSSFYNKQVNRFREEVYNREDDFWQENRLEELNGDEKEEMYCVGTNMPSNEITGPTIFANGICIGAGENTAYGEL